MENTCIGRMVAVVVGGVVAVVGGGGEVIGGGDGGCRLVFVCDICAFTARSPTQYRLGLIREIDTPEFGWYVFRTFAATRYAVLLC